MSRAAREADHRAGVGSVAAGGALTTCDKFLDLLESPKMANAHEPTTFVMAPKTETAMARLKEATTHAPPAVHSALSGVRFVSRRFRPTKAPAAT